MPEEANEAPINQNSDPTESNRTIPENIFLKQRILHDKLINAGFDFSDTTINIPDSIDSANKAHSEMEKILHPGIESQPDWEESPFYVVCRDRTTGKLDFVTRTVFDPSVKRLSENVITEDQEKSSVGEEIRNKVESMGYDEADIAMLAGAARTTETRGNYKPATLYRLALAAQQKLLKGYPERPLVIASTIRMENELSLKPSSELLMDIVSKILPSESFGFAGKVDRDIPTQLFIAVIPHEDLEHFMYKVKKEFNSSANQ